MYQYKQSGLDNVWLENGYTIQQTPYGEAVHIEDANGLDAAIARTLIFSEETLNGRAFRFLRQQLGMSQSDIGSLMGVDSQTVARWEKGVTQIPLTSDIAMRAIYMGVEKKEASVVSLLEMMKAIDKAKHCRIVLSNLDSSWQGSQELCAV